MTDDVAAKHGGRLGWREHPVEFALGLFGEVHPGETGTVLLMVANLFLLLTAYYLLKVAREPLILLGGGAEVKSYAAVGQAVLLIFVSNLYGWLAARVRRLVLIASVTTFFAANLALFWALGSRGVPLGVPFFLWVGIFNLVTVTQFWSFAADTYTEEQGKRLFPIIGIGSSAGAIGGAAMAGTLIHAGSPFTLMLVAAAILMSALGITYIIQRREIARLAGARDKRHDEPVAKGNAFALVAHDRYLLLIAALILILNISTKTGDYVLDRMLIAHAAEHATRLGVTQSAYIGEFKARFFEWINVSRDRASVVLRLTHHQVRRDPRRPHLRPPRVPHRVHRDPDRPDDRRPLRDARRGEQPRLLPLADGATGPVARDVARGEVQGEAGRRLLRLAGR